MFSSCKVLNKEKNATQTNVHVSIGYEKYMKEIQIELVRDLIFFQIV